MFAFLFGYGMVQFYSSRLRRGMPEVRVRHMLWRRHWWMIVFGLFHAGLLFAGDILGVYGLSGLLLGWLFFRRRDRVLKVVLSIIGGLLALTAVMSLLSAVLLSALPPEIAAATGVTSSSAEFTVGAQRDTFSGDDNYLTSALTRLGFWAMGLFAQFVALVIPASILFGWLAARHRYLEEPERHRKLLLRVSVWGIVIGILGALPQALHYLDIVSLADYAWWGYTGLVSLTGMFGGLGYASLFGLLTLRFGHRLRGFLSAVAAVGQRSLSFYLLQAVIFAPLLSAWGLGLGERLNTTAALGIAVVVWLVSLPLAAQLAKRSRRGPAEALLRRLTYGADDSPRVTRLGT